MPLNTLRLNHVPSSHPNDRIVFIKPLQRPASLASDYQTADTLLRAIAAQCLPIMKSHYLSVTTLEEHEPNPEFIGRNFNNGEIIQLVLRGKNGGWLPVSMIQMVMMHELAHNVHMNHSRKFWDTRNLFAGEMKALWAKGYTGEGLWGSGRTLSQLGDAVTGNLVQSEELKDLPLCGGTFRSRRKKRKSKNEGLSWKEKKERRIEKKFGKNGVALGEDEDKRLSLEINGKGPLGIKPRVAQSKRGRELRVTAALARFETNKKEVESLETLKSEDEADDTQSDGDYEELDVAQEDARDTNGQRLLDSKGEGMIKTCEDEDRDDVNVKLELEELNSLDLRSFTKDSFLTHAAAPSSSSAAFSKPNVGANHYSRSLYDIPQHVETPLADPPSSSQRPPSGNTNSTKPKIIIHKPLTSARSATKSISPPSKPEVSPTLTTTSSSESRTPALPTKTSKPNTISCPICSLTNSTLNLTCQACSHVLDRRKDPRSWNCVSEACEGSEYINAGDVGVCAVCGARKSS